MKLEFTFAFEMNLLFNKVFFFYRNKVYKKIHRKRKKKGLSKHITYPSNSKPHFKISRLKKTNNTLFLYDIKSMPKGNILHYSLSVVKIAFPKQIKIF